ncbi:TPA_asm: RNA-directed RNA polymerase [ssRNA phage SRR7976357_4]|uniref:RNA-directed RNA polymerase n=1 Tax=ssRNA phage SRR7976357_4 TaxID=2786744 RepID=A0A8S5L1E1_9VIRU|nr:RNA-directed RNA polymerase [ssRNA phage SRR7976357_4]DAD51247.1 TPA_asm: RNA-directed RNA polymerase [ssRNA phage SRR7976357_4]
MKKRRVADLGKLFQVMVSDLQSFKNGSEPQNFAAARLLDRMRKRASLGSVAELKAKALTKFVQINEHVSQRALNLTAEEIQRASGFIRAQLERFTRRTFGDEFAGETFCYQWVWDNWRFGPGASNGTRGTHPAEKIQQKLSSTLACQPFVTKLRCTHPGWIAIDCESGPEVTLVEGSRITVVPKNEDAVRTIAIEPSGNMAIQLALGRYLEGALCLMGLDIQKQQPINKKFAQYGSLTGRIATLDLSSASDLIGRDLVRLLFPSEWVLLFELTRSQKCEIEKQSHALNMISTMGNGYTFPLMTMIITSLIYATRTNTKNYISWYETAVFGDDIIVPVEEVEKTISILERAGFIINHDKSYSFGPFRESCGGDYYEGVDVTPFYVKTVNTQMEVFVAINQLLEWWAKTRIPLRKSYDYLVEMLHLNGHKVYFVPEWMNPDQGILSADCPRSFKYLSRNVEKRSLPTSSPFAIALASAGYVASGESPERLYYTTRECKSRVVVRTGRIPVGFRSGWAAEKRTHEVSQFIALVTQ